MSPELNGALCAAAARNNAVWCDAMARLHGGSGAFVTAAWINRQAAPRFHPNLVTLDGRHETPAHRATLDLLMQSPPPPGWAVKDSFAALDLGSMGFDPLFEARWIHWPAGIFGASGAQRLMSAAMLAAWERAWCGDDVGAIGLFPPALLQAPDHAVIAALQDGAIVGGCIATRSDGVLGISNLFAPATDDGSVRAACLDAAAPFAPNAPLVGYERGDSLARMMELGFRAIGALKVWQAPRR